MFLIALLVLAVLWLLLANWQLTLIALGTWMLIRITVAAVDRKDRSAGRERPAAVYLPRWTARRRLDARREHALWQEWFDAREVAQVPRSSSEAEATVRS